MTEGAKRPGEFELIAKYFAPLSSKEKGAFGLKDDAALFKPKAGREIVLKTDAIVAGVHFLVGDPPDTIAQKALGVNVSDLAAKGATPRVYLLTLALPHTVDEAWLESFAHGLKQAQERFAITLVGGDTTATPGPLTISVTAVGDVARGRMLKRSGAKSGDDLWVSGTIGDAALGLHCLNGRPLGLSAAQRHTLIARYRLPEPRLALGLRLSAVAHACLDISDGVIADFGHMAAASRVAIELEAESVPLSPAGRAAVAAGAASLTDLLTAGDDYELAIAAPQKARRRMEAMAAKTATPLTRIGRVVKGQGVTARAADGASLAFARRGYTHF